MIISIFFSYSIQAYVAFEILWENLFVTKLKKNKTFWEYFLRTSLTIIYGKNDYKIKFLTKKICKKIINIFLFLVIAGIIVPLLDLYMSLFGAFCLSALGIIFPAVIEICTKWAGTLKFRKIMLFKNIIIITLGFIGMAIGTFVNLVKILEAM